MGGKNEYCNPFMLPEIMGCFTLSDVYSKKTEQVKNTRFAGKIGATLSPYIYFFEQ